MLLAVTFLIGTMPHLWADQTQIPFWVKNNAKWWSKGQIEDSDFVKGIQYLIQQQIIKIPKTSSLSDTQNKIPVWIKNNAGWWADGTIGDEDFIKGIQYLIQVNIIHINSQQIFGLSSSVFENDGNIPSKYTCDGDNISPPLSITGIPENTKSLALIVDDVDAPLGSFTHWIVWNIPPAKVQFLEGEDTELPQGMTSFGKAAYGGPCPPAGSTHRYFFKLYALDSVLNLDEGAAKNDLEQSMSSHIISQTILVGRYER